MTISEQIENLNLINKGLIRSVRIHTRKGNIKCVETIQTIINHNINTIVSLMKQQ